MKVFNFPLFRVIISYLGFLYTTFSIIGIVYSILYSKNRCHRFGMLLLIVAITGIVLVSYINVLLWIVCNKYHAWIVGMIGSVHFLLIYLGLMQMIGKYEECNNQVKKYGIIYFNCWWALSLLGGMLYLIIFWINKSTCLNKKENKKSNMESNIESNVELTETSYLLNVSDFDESISNHLEFLEMDLDKMVSIEKPSIN